MTPFKFMLVTDTHYFANSLGAYGPEYEEYMTTQQKCCGETQAINEAVFDYLGKLEETDTVLIAGDLTFNGEKQSHEEFSAMLRELKNKGKKIYVITAGHDYSKNSFAYRGGERISVEGIERGDLLGYYHEFGFDDAIEFDEESLSYVAQLTDGVRLLALNNDGTDASPKTYSARQIEWILRQTKKARQDGQMMIAMNHYPILPGYPVLGLVGDAVMPNGDSIARMLADEGVHLCFTGHMHNQSINCVVTEKGNTFWDVCTAAVIGCPAYMRMVTLNSPEEAVIRSIPTPAFEWDFGGLTQDQYLTRMFDTMIGTYLDYMEHDPKKMMSKLGVKDCPDLLCKIISPLGKGLNNATVGSFAKKFGVKADASIYSGSLRELLLAVVRNIFVGNAPYVWGTPEYDVIMGVLSRFKPVFAILKAKTGRDYMEIIRTSIGKYGVDDYDATLKLK